MNYWNSVLASNSQVLAEAGEDLRHRSELLRDAASEVLRARPISWVSDAANIAKLDREIISMHHDSLSNSLLSLAESIPQPHANWVNSSY